MGNNQKQILCINCSDYLKKDDIALNKKLLGSQIEKFLCLNCLAEYLNSDVNDLLVKIEEFKEQGCVLFK